MVKCGSDPGSRRKCGERQDAITALSGQGDAVKALGAISLFIWSTARDEANAQSDLDLFVEYDRCSHSSLVELVGIKQLLERRVGASVGLTTRDSLDPLLRGRIEASAERVSLTERLVRQPPGSKVWGHAILGAMM